MKSDLIEVFALQGVPKKDAQKILDEKERQEVIAKLKEVGEKTEQPLFDVYGNDIHKKISYINSK